MTLRMYGFGDCGNVVTNIRRFEGGAPASDAVPWAAMSPTRSARSAALAATFLSALSVLACHGTSDPPKPAASATAAPTNTAASASAKPVDSAMVDHYMAHGVVKSIDPEKKKLSIAHDDISGFMKAMTMPFEVKDASLLAGIAVGDTVDFGFTDDGSGHLVIDKLVKK